MPIRARAYWLATNLIGMVLSAMVLFHWKSGPENPIKFTVYLLAAVGTSRLKVRLPGVLGTLSMNYLFMFLALLELDLASALVIALLGILAQTLIAPKQRPQWEQVLFNVLAIAIPIVVAGSILRLPDLRSVDSTGFVGLLCASTTYFLLNTGLVSIMIGLIGAEPPFVVWRESFLWTAPQYIFGGALAGAVHLFGNSLPWQAFLLSAPAIFLIYTAYAQYLGRVGRQQKDLADLAQLHWRTIEALALAIQAKDDTTATHLRRIQVLATDVARELQLSPNDMKAVEAAALLHDIGKLAVPEYILSKPGRLTAEEFEKVKIHTLVGAEILERVDFPYPVVPIVRSHHEKFDGTGYPDGLKGEAIPIGARVIAAVDCLDALASDRQYRSALPEEEAMEYVSRESGKSFDPRIVAIVLRKYRELNLSGLSAGNRATSETQAVKIRNHSARLSGLAQPRAKMEPSGQNFAHAIASARREVQLLVETTNDMETSSSLEDTLEILAMRLGECIPHDTIVFYVSEGGCLSPRFVKGESRSLFCSLRIPLGEGLSGWVAGNNRPIVNGNPAVEPGYMNDLQRIAALQSAISIPLWGDHEVIGVLSLYSLRPMAFNQDHLRVLLAVRTKAGAIIHNLLRLTQLQSAAETDELTGLLNAGALFKALTAETAKAKAAGSSFVIIVLDLDGFKMANDRFGHLAGNRILQKVATELTALSLSTDHVARLGGDEFVLILQGRTEGSLSSFLDQVHEIGPRVSLQVLQEPVVKISLGVARYPDDGLDPESILEVADQEMYKAKRARKALASALVAPRL